MRYRISGGRTERLTDWRHPSVKRMNRFSCVYTKRLDTMTNIASIALQLFKGNKWLIDWKAKIYWTWSPLIIGEISINYNKSAIIILQAIGLTQSANQNLLELNQRKSYPFPALSQQNYLSLKYVAKKILVRNRYSMSDSFLSPYPVCVNCAVQ